MCKGLSNHNVLDMTVLQINTLVTSGQCGSLNLFTKNNV